MGALEKTDPEIAALIREEERFQMESLRLIPSENYTSAAVLEAAGSVLTNKYSEGYPGKRYYEGQRFIDRLETLVQERAKALFHMDHANVQPYSGSPANQSTYYALQEPRATMILCRAEHAEAIDKAVFPALQGGPHNHTTAAIGVALAEANTPAFREYAHQVVRNARGLAAGRGGRGLELVTGGTDTHLILIDLTNKGVIAKKATKALDRAGIVVNYNTIPYDPRKPFSPSGIRIGTPAVTSRGMGEGEMRQIAALMAEAPDHVDDEG